MLIGLRLSEAFLLYGFWPTRFIRASVWRILRKGFATKRLTSSERMMSKADDQSDWSGKRIDFGSFAKDLMRRRAALGQDLAVPRNNGERRTPSKRALLSAIETTGKTW